MDSSETGNLYDGERDEESIAPPPKPDWEESSDIPHSDMPLMQSDVLSSEEFSQGQDNLAADAVHGEDDCHSDTSHALTSKLSDVRALDEESRENTLNSVHDMDDHARSDSRGSFLHDQDIPELSDSLTEAMMSSAKGKTTPIPKVASSSDSLDARLEELNESDLASLIPEVTSSSYVASEQSGAIESINTTSEFNYTQQHSDDDAIFKVPRYNPDIASRKTPPCRKKTSNESVGDNDQIFSSQTELDEQNGGTDLNSDNPKRKRGPGRPPKLKPKDKSKPEDKLPCARTVPYSWKNKTREEKLAVYKRLLNAERDNLQQETHKKRNDSPLSSHTLVDTQRTHKKVNASQGSLNCGSDSGAGSEDQRGHNSSSHSAMPPVPPLPYPAGPALPDYHDIQRPHVSPDSGISSGGSPLPSVSSPHHHGTTTHHYAPVEGRMHHSQGSDHYDNSRVPQINNTGADYTDTIKPSVPSSQKAVTNTGVEKSEQKVPGKRGRKPYKHLLKNGGHIPKGKSKVSDKYSAVGNIVKKSRGRPKGSLNKKTLEKMNNVDQPAVNHEISGNPPAKDNIFERLHDISSDNVSLMNKEAAPSVFKKRPFKRTKTFPLNKHSAIASHISKALKMSAKLKAGDGVKKKRGRPRIHPIPVKRGRGRGRPKKTPVDSIKSIAAPESLQTNHSHLITNVPVQNEDNVDKSSVNISPSLEEISCYPKQQVTPIEDFTSHIQGANKNVAQLDTSPKVDEFAKLMQSVHRISSKFNNWPIPTSQTEDAGTTDSEEEYTGLNDDKDDSKLMPKIRKSKLDLQKKRVRRRQASTDTSFVYDMDLLSNSSSFSLPAGAYAFHRHPCSSTSAKYTVQNIAESMLSPESHTPQCDSPSMSKSVSSEQIKTSQKSPAAVLPVASPSALPMSPCSTSGSHVSAKDVADQDLNRRKQKKKKSKHFKTKHKNVVDPVFVAEVDNLASDIGSLKISDVGFGNFFSVSKPVFQIRKSISKENIRASSGPDKIQSAQDVVDEKSPVTEVESSVKQKKARKRRHIQDGLDMIRKPKPHHSLPIKKRSKQDSTGEMPDEAAVATPVAEPASRVEAEPAESEDPQALPPKKRRGRPKKDQQKEKVDEEKEDDVLVRKDNQPSTEIKDVSEDHVTRSRSRSFGGQYSMASSNTDADAENSETSSKNVSNLTETGMDVEATAVILEPLKKKSTGRPGRPRKHPEVQKDNKVKKGSKHNQDNTQDKNASTNLVTQSNQSDIAMISNKDSSEKQSVNTGTEIALQADFDIQCDLEENVEESTPKEKPKKKGIDIGVQAYPEELRELAKQAEEEARRKSQSEIAVQVDDENDMERRIATCNAQVTQPLEIQVNFDAETATQGLSSPGKCLTPCRRSPRSHPPPCAMRSPRTYTSPSHRTSTTTSPISSPDKVSQHYSPAYSDISAASKTNDMDTNITYDRTPTGVGTSCDLFNAEVCSITLLNRSNVENHNSPKQPQNSKTNERISVIESISPTNDRKQLQNNEVTTCKTSQIQEPQSSYLHTSNQSHIDPHTSVIRRAEKSNVSPHRPPMHSNQPDFLAVFQNFLSTGSGDESARSGTRTRSSRRPAIPVDLTDEALLSSAYANADFTIEDNTGVSEDNFIDDEDVDQDTNVGRAAEGGQNLGNKNHDDSQSLSPHTSQDTISHGTGVRSTKKKSKTPFKGWGHRKRRDRHRHAKVIRLKHPHLGNSIGSQGGNISSEDILDTSIASLDTSVDTIENQASTTTTLQLKNSRRKDKRQRTKGSRKSPKSKPQQSSEPDEMIDALDTSLDTTFDKGDQATPADMDTSLEQIAQDFNADTTKKCSTKSKPSRKSFSKPKKSKVLDRTNSPSPESNLDTTLEQIIATPTESDAHSEVSTTKNNNVVKQKEKRSKKTRSKTTEISEEASESILDASILVTSEVINPSNKKDVIVIGSETEGEDTSYKTCEDCIQLQRKGKSKKRRCQLHKPPKKQRVSKAQTLAQAPAQSGTESDKDCIVVLERLDSGELRSKRDRNTNNSAKLNNSRTRSVIRSTRSHDMNTSATAAKSSLANDSVNVTTSDMSFRTGDSQANTTDTFISQEESITLDDSIDQTVSAPDTTITVISPETSPEVDKHHKRQNTNSEYDPLPVVLKKKKKSLKNDMGYSQPRKKRRKKKRSDDVSTAESRPEGEEEEEEEDEAPLPCSSMEMETIDLSASMTEEESSQCCTESESVSGSRPGTPAKRSADGSILPRKRYQRVGLFSDAFKQSDAYRRILKKPDLKVDVYNPDDFKYGLMPDPIHIGKYLREKRVDFELPYDVWFLHEHDLLKPTKLPSPKYRKIRHNVYVDCKGISKHETHSCLCRKPSDPNEKSCLPDTCLNRMIYTECNHGECPVGENCSNNRIQRYESARGLEKFKTSDRGYGVRSKMPVEPGEYIVEYIGEVITEKEFQRRMTEDYSKDHHHYCLNLDSGLVIDGYRMGNLSRFVNHSCDPNCEMQKWNVNGYYRMGLFSIKDIPPGTELTYDYNFHSYNAQQTCRCGSEACRGVLGGRALQRPNGLIKDKHAPGTPKDKRKSKHRKQRDKEKLEVQRSLSQHTPVKPLSHRERCFVQKQGVFLLRNLNKVRQLKHKSTPSTPSGEQLNPFEAFHTNLNALNTARTVRTRGLSTAQDHPEVAKMAQLAQILQIIYISVTSYKDEEGVELSEPLKHCPSRKRNPEYYELIKEPIDLTVIESRVLSGYYKSLDSFEADFLKLFRNVEKYCGKESDIGKAVAVLEKLFYTAKNENIADLHSSPYASSSSVATSQNTSRCATPVTSAPSECGDSSIETSTIGGDTAAEDTEEEEVIRCLCNIYRDEGLMLQCEKCETWQHVDCMGNPDSEHYMCERCNPRPISKEVLMSPIPDDAKPGCTYYLTLMRDESLQVRVSDCYYVIKDALTHDKKTGRWSVDYTQKALNPDALCIFRIDRLWREEKSGDKFAFGHYYLRPHETFHEANRRFFANEVFRFPRYEIVPLEALVKLCVVMDLSSYCKGRPKGVVPTDVYVCEYRVDKNARMFKRISKPNYPINTKSYCFDRFPAKLHPRRTYTPFEVPDKYKKSCSRSHSDNASESGKSQISDVTTPEDEEDSLPLAKIKEQQRSAKKKSRLHVFCDKLRNSQETYEKEDVTYMLAPGKKKPRKPLLQ